MRQAVIARGKLKGNCCIKPKLAISKEYKTHFDRENINCSISWLFVLFLLYFARKCWKPSMPWESFLVNIQARIIRMNFWKWKTMTVLQTIRLISILMMFETDSVKIQFFFLSFCLNEINHFKLLWLQWILFVYMYTYDLSFIPLCFID